MGYQIDLGAWNAVFAVPSVLVDRHIKLAGKEQLQTILWVLRHAGEPFDSSTLSAALNISTDSALDALDYWTDCGLLVRSEETFSPPPVQAPSPEAAPASPQSPASSPQPAEQASIPVLPPKPKRLLRPDGLYLSARIQESESIRYLMQEAELTLGKTVSPALSSALLSICDDYGLPVEVIVMILHYCKEVGKTSTAYIESVSRDWAQSGIFTLEAAEEKLRALNERRLAWGKVSAAAGLPRRAPTKKEEEAAFRWVKEWKFSPEMLSGAYERCADHIGKFSVGYLNKILERWHKLGFTTMEQVEAEEQQKQAEQNNKKSYDVEELERMSFFDLPEDL